MKGIILAGGRGTRLHPLTLAVSKQLLPIFDKPMIYYPLSTLMKADIQDILIITNPEDTESFQRLLGNGSQFGINLSYATQAEPNGIAEAFIIAEEFIGHRTVALVLGDNLFHGGGNFDYSLIKAKQRFFGATIFTYTVKDPERYGVASFDQEGKIEAIVEKPIDPPSNQAVTGLYFYDSTVVSKAKTLQKSDRGELEITDLNRLYLEEKTLRVERMEVGSAWLDTGTHDSLVEATEYVRAVENRQGIKVGCPEEIAWFKSWISKSQLEERAMKLRKTEYGQYLLSLLKKA